MTEKFTPVKRLWRLLSTYRREIRQIYTLAVLIGFVNLTLPLGIQAIVNFIQTGEITVSWVLLVCFVLIGIAITGLLQVLQLRIVENIQQDLFSRSAFEFAYRIPKITFLELDRTHAPELVNRFFDTLTIQKGLPKILIDFSLAAFQIIFGLILLSIYSPYFVLLGISLIVILYIIFQVTGPRGMRTSLKESKYKYNLAHWLQEIARVNRSFKLNTSSNLHLTRTDDIATKYLTSRENHFKVLLNQFQMFVGFKVIVAAALLLLGGYLVFEEQMNIGQFVAAEIIILLIINSVEKILRVIETIYDVLTALEKIGFVTELKLDRNVGVIEISDQKGYSIKTNEIKFQFPMDDNPKIDNLSFEIPSHSKVYLTGNSGSGKTLLMQILAGIHTIDEGEFYINDIPFSNYNKEGLYKHIGLTFPSNQLFEGTIKENITLGREIEYKKLLGMINYLELYNFLAHQPKGLDTEIDSGGRRLPGSIIQKLLLARVLIGSPRLMLLENPLSSVESEDKKRIIDFIFEKFEYSTIIVISDFYYWKERCNQIINLSKLS